jgi:hypothetical protein
MSAFGGKADIGGYLTWIKFKVVARELSSMAAQAAGIKGRLTTPFCSAGGLS